MKDNVLIEERLGVVQHLYAAALRERSRQDNR
jgi:hypothetical protein